MDPGAGGVIGDSQATGPTAGATGTPTSNISKFMVMNPMQQAPRVPGVPATTDVEGGPGPSTPGGPSVQAVTGDPSDASNAVATPMAGTPLPAIPKVSAVVPGLPRYFESLTLTL